MIDDRGLQTWTENSPQDAHSTFDAAVRCHNAGRLAEAERLYRQVLSVDAQHANSLYALGILAQQTGRSAAAAQLVRAAVRIHDDVAAYHSALGVALRALGMFDEALASLHRALALAPNDADVHNNLGITLRARGRLSEAAAHFERAVALAPANATCLCNLAGALRERGNLGESIACLQRAIALKPNFAAAYSNLGHALRENGRLDDALRAHEMAIRFEPQTARHYHDLFRLRRAVADDAHLAALERLAEDAHTRPIEDQTELQFALGKAYVDLAQHERAFRHWLKGNTLKRRQVVYNEAAMLGLMERIRRIFSSELLGSLRGAGHSSDRPIFIVGMPRSGTSLAEQILASHPKVHGVGERGALADIVLGMEGPSGAPMRFPDDVPALSRQQLLEIGTRYVRAVTAGAPRAERVTDKMPDNIRFSGLIALALPNARIIHMRRNALDNCVSCFSTLFAYNFPYNHDLGELGRYYRTYEELSAHWRRVLPAGMMLEVHYEELVTDLEKETRRMLAHCGLEWNDACLAFYKTSRPVQTASAVQVRQPIYPTSIGRWRSYGDLLRPLIEALGPELV